MIGGQSFRTPPPLAQCSKNLVSHGTKMYIVQQPKRQVDLSLDIFSNKITVIIILHIFVAAARSPEFESIACVCLSDRMLPEAKKHLGERMFGLFV